MQTTPFRHIFTVAHLATCVLVAGWIWSAAAPLEPLAPASSPIHWTHATGAGLVLVSVDRESSGRYAVTVSDPNTYQEFEYTVPRYSDGRLYRTHIWEVWTVAPKVPRSRLGVRDFDAPALYGRIIFSASTSRGDVPWWLEVREGHRGVIVEVTTVLP